MTLSTPSTLCVNFIKEKADDTACVVVPVFAGKVIAAGVLSAVIYDFVTHAVGVHNKFAGKHGEILDLMVPAGQDVARVIVLGLGDKDELSALKSQEAGGKLAAHLARGGVEHAALLSHEGISSVSLKEEDLLSHLAYGARLRHYSFDHYKSAPADQSGFKTLDIVYERCANAEVAFAALDAVSAGVFQARDLVNMPPNDLYPEAYAKIIKDELKPLGVEVEILDEKKMLKLGMGAIMAVGQGSDRLPRMVTMRWNGAGGKSKGGPIAFVGKGVTFDTGGISLKPGAGMDEMKMDMGGSAAVVGLMKTLALRKAKVDVVAVVGLAENMPSARAYRPGDIITSYSGKTIEVLNTDAEGRLVLADCLTHVQKEFNPSFVIDLATLTGAIMVALGHEYCGTYVNKETLWKQMESASGRTGEKLWRMPLDPEWNKQVKSDVADLQNIGKIARLAGSCTAAAFLQSFIDEGREWAHMDIAGTAWRKSDQPTVPKHGSGFGVSILNDLVATYYEG